MKSELGSVDYLVNNAGITRDKLIMMMSQEDWDAVIDTNLKGVFNITKPAVSVMVRQRRGSILNIASISGVVGMAGQTNYSASKAGTHRVHQGAGQRGWAPEHHRQCARAGVDRDRYDRRLARRL